MVLPTDKPWGYLQAYAILCEWHALCTGARAAHHLLSAECGVCCPVAVLCAGRKKRRGHNDTAQDSSNAGVPLEQNHAQIIQYMPPGAGGVDYALLHHLTGMMPPVDVAAAFERLHLAPTQVRHGTDLGWCGVAAVPSSHTLCAQVLSHCLTDHAPSHVGITEEFIQRQTFESSRHTCCAVLFGTTGADTV